KWKKTMKELEKTKTTLKDDYVPKKELEEEYISKGRVRNMTQRIKEDLDTLTAEVDALGEEQTKLKNRMGGMAMAFKPATEYALFEDAVYAAIKNVMPRELATEKDRDALSYSMQRICRDVANKLLKDSDSPADIVFYSLGQKSILSPSQKKEVLLRALGGLAAYIRLIDNKTVLETVWNNPEKRGKVSHNGKFLNSFYATPPATEEGSLAYDNEKNRVKYARQKFLADLTTSKYQPTSVGRALALIVREFREYRLDIEAEAVTWLETKIANRLH
ncbi:MAG: hypothetical protein SGILL_004821, partial [Bacillariaceae sp.]